MIGTMLADERQRLICEQLQQQGQVQVSKIAQELQVSEETIRRDIALLERQNLLRRVHGGAMPVREVRREPPFEVRAAENRESRSRLGKAAAQMVQENEIIAMDSGVTTEAMAEAMQGCHGVTVVTASVAVLCILMNKKHAGIFEGNVYFLGGLLNEQEQTTVGALTTEQLKRFSFDKAFVSATAVDTDGVYMAGAEGGELAAAMLERAQQGILLAGSEKLGQRSVYRYARLSQLDAMITDAGEPVPAAFCTALRQNSVKLTVAV